MQKNENRKFSVTAFQKFTAEQTLTIRVYEL